MYFLVMGSYLTCCVWITPYGSVICVSYETTFAGSAHSAHSTERNGQRQRQRATRCERHIRMQKCAVLCACVGAERRQGRLLFGKMRSLPSGTMPLS